MKKGYTLMEIMAVMSIILIISSFGLMAAKFYKRIKRDYLVETAAYEVENMVLLGKEKAIKENTSGEIVFQLKNRELIVKLLLNNGYREESNLSNALIPYSDYSEELGEYIKSISISNRGQLSATTIDFKAITGDLYKLTTRVGVDLVVFERVENEEKGI